MLNPLVSIAEDALRTWHGNDITRETATALLPTWRWAHVLTDVEREELLRLFPLDEPAMVPGKDYLPDLPPVVEHYATAAWSGGLIDPWVDCSCGASFIADSSELAYAALDKHVADEKAKAEMLAVSA